jgi:hypothetical protein
MEQPGFFEGIESIEEAIAPSVALLLDTAIESASLARPGLDAECHAQALRALARDAEALIRELEGLAPPAPLYRDSGAA